MSQTAQKLFDSLKNVKEAVLTVAPGLENFGPEVGAKLKQLFEHGASEGASLLNTGHAFVIYGPAQRAPDIQYPEAQRDEVQHEMEHER